MPINLKIRHFIRLKFIKINQKSEFYSFKSSKIAFISFIFKPTRFWRLHEIFGDFRDQNNKKRQFGICQQNIFLRKVLSENYGESILTRKCRRKRKVEIEATRKNLSWLFKVKLSRHFEYFEFFFVAKDWPTIEQILI